jgi:hypothetical protein
MLFSDPRVLREWFSGKTVAIVGSGPGVLENEPGFVDSHDVVVRVNNYRTSKAAGYRTDVFYSFHGSSIKKTREELKADGVGLVMCKCPDAKFMDSEWHRKNNKPNGVDFRYIYRDRAKWWFCPTYLPSTAEFLEVFDRLSGRIPTTGFAAIYEVLKHGPTSVYLTGFDGFSSGIHNVNETWRAGNPKDPIGHAPEREIEWLRLQHKFRSHPDNERQPLTRIYMDNTLKGICAVLDA